MFSSLGTISAEELRPVQEPTKGLGYTLLPDGTYSVNRGVLNIPGVLHTDVAGLVLVIPATHLGKAVTAIEKEAFALKRIVKLVLPDSLKEIGDSAFEGCSDSFEDVIIPPSVMTIGTSAFKGCDALQKITLNEGLQNISDNAFEKCIRLESITLPASVHTTGNEAFLGVGDWVVYNFPAIRELEYPPLKVVRSFPLSRLQ